MWATTLSSQGHKTRTWAPGGQWGGVGLRAVCATSPNVWSLQAESPWGRGDLQESPTHVWPYPGEHGCLPWDPKVQTVQAQGTPKVWWGIKASLLAL